MKNYLKLAVLAFILVTAASCNKQAENKDSSQTPVITDEFAADNSVISATVVPNCAAFPISDLNDAEKKVLLHIREEEKMARDVYTAMYAKWNKVQFKFIAASEQVHMNAMLNMVKRYSLTDPVGTNGAGIFVDTELKTRYDQLIALGNTSLADAYRVGATVEDLDLADLYDAIKGTDNADLKMVYSNLAKATRNHMRSFYYSLKALGVTYTPQFISQELYNAIVSSPIERGPAK